MKHFQTQEETEELQGFQVQELAKVKHMVMHLGIWSSSFKIFSTNILDL